MLQSHSVAIFSASNCKRPAIRFCDKFLRRFDSDSLAFATATEPLHPVQRSFFPGPDIPDNQDPEENPHLQQPE